MPNHLDTALPVASQRPRHGTAQCGSTGLCFLQPPKAISRVEDACINPKTANMQETRRLEEVRGENKYEQSLKDTAAQGLLPYLRRTEIFRDGSSGSMIFFLCTQFPKLSRVNTSFRPEIHLGRTFHKFCCVILGLYGGIAPGAGSG